MTRFADMSDESLLETFYDEENETVANDAFTELDCRYRERFLMSLLVPGYNKRFVKLYKMPGMEQKAEDLVGEALFRVAVTKSRPTARWQANRSSVHAWLFGILRNVVVSYLRRKRHEVRPDSEFQSVEGEPTPLDQTPAPEPTPDEALQHQALVCLLRECVQELPADLQLLCEMLFEQGKKQTEIAAALNVSTPTLTRRKKDACQLLKRCLRRKGVVDLPL